MNDTGHNDAPQASREGPTADAGAGPRVHLGVDGTRGRWVAVAVDDDGAFRSAVLVDTLEEILRAFPGAATLAIDVPIGLPASGPRAADLEAKMLLGPRRSTIFPVPPRAVLEAATYAEARELARELTGKSISAQSFALRHNILEAAPLGADPRVFEVHPELAFRALAGRVLLTSKRTWNGAQERQRSLAAAGLELPGSLGDAGDAPVDDVLDAAVCAWSARRISAGEAQCVPTEPELDGDGRPMAIWF